MAEGERKVTFDDAEEEKVVEPTNAKSAVEAAIQRSNEAKEVAREEVSPFVVSTSFVGLPSKGKLYSSDSPLFEKEEIEIRQMTALEEDILTSRNLIRGGKAIDMVIKNCLIDKSIDVDQLVAGDKNAIMIALRITGYGKDYDVTVTCPTCQEDSAFPFDLSLLKANDLNLKTATEGNNNFNYKTPSGNKLVFKFLTSGEQKDMVETQANLKKATGSVVDHSVTDSMKRMILSVDGEEKRSAVDQFVNTMPARDSRAFRKFTDDNEPDVIMKQMFECKACGERNEVTVPITVEFFWPD